MIDLKKLARLREAAEQARDRQQRAEGRKRQLLDTLKKDFDCDNLKQAKTLLANLGLDEEKLAAEFAELEEAFTEQYGDKLTEGDE